MPTKSNHSIVNSVTFGRRLIDLFYLIRSLALNFPGFVLLALASAQEEEVTSSAVVDFEIYCMPFRFAANMCDFFTCFK